MTDKKFDNEAFTKWLVDFEAALIEFGMTESQAMRFRGERYRDAISYFVAGDSPDDAAAKKIVVGD